jgi:hypothetical protein
MPRAKPAAAPRIPPVLDPAADDDPLPEGSDEAVAFTDLERGGVSAERARCLGCIVRDHS